MLLKKIKILFLIPLCHFSMAEQLNEVTSYYKKQITEKSQKYLAVLEMAKNKDFTKLCHTKDLSYSCFDDELKRWMAAPISGGESVLIQQTIVSVAMTLGKIEISRSPTDMANHCVASTALGIWTATFLKLAHVVPGLELPPKKLITSKEGAADWQKIQAHEEKQIPIDWESSRSHMVTAMDIFIKGVKAQKADNANDKAALAKCSSKLEKIASIFVNMKNRETASSTK